ncbi:MAG: glutaredoxin 3 [Acidobacteriota bacterium]|nr:glutaredoxin 3 [Acidobacteriota bacterium]MDH3784788.1 glutaredoxin 3 [Acidobacteriota bacterium]
MTRKIVMYTRSWCGYCSRAKRLLDSRELEYDEIDIGRTPEATAEMLKRSGGRYTVPQVFIDDVHIGGSDELLELAERGGLDEEPERRSDSGECS